MKGEIDLTQRGRRFLGLMNLPKDFYLSAKERTGLPAWEIKKAWGNAEGDMHAANRALDAIR